MLYNGTKLAGTRRPHSSLFAVHILWRFRGIRDDIESEDVQEAFFRYMEENPMAGVIIEDDEIVEYDEDGNAIIPEKKVGG